MHDFSTNSCLVENFVAEEGHRQILVRKKKNKFLVISDRKQILHLKFSQDKVYRYTTSVSPTTPIQLS